MASEKSPKLSKAKAKIEKPLLTTIETQPMVATRVKWIPHYHGYLTLPIFCKRHWSSRADVVLLHPHGFIPFGANGPQSEDEDFVFDQRSYSEVIGQESHPWRQLLLSIMRTHTCLFIGLSGKDQNLDSLLLACQKGHASHGANTAYWGVTLTTSTDVVVHRAWEERGVFCHVIEDYARDLPAFLFQICQKAADRRGG